MIYQEPVGEVRKAAMDDLASKLGIGGINLCALAVDVNVYYETSPLYAARNIGFPGCPGATMLPGD
jgi:hypothetical protein